MGADAETIFSTRSRRYRTYQDTIRNIKTTKPAPLTAVAASWRQVFFVVGNHEMWTGRRRLKAAEGSEGEEAQATQCSVEKLVQMHGMCQVRRGRAAVVGKTKSRLVCLLCAASWGVWCSFFREVAAVHKGAQLLSV